MNSRERIRVCLKDKRGSLNAKQILRKISVLCEGRQFVEAAHLVDRLNPSALELAENEIPLDLLVESLPFSSVLLFCLLQRLSQITNAKPSEVLIQKIIWKLVNLFSVPCCDPVILRKCEKLISFVCCLKPDIKIVLKDKEALLDSAVQALAVHGLTDIRNEPDGNFMTLCSALRQEIKLHVETYKQVILLLETSKSTDPAHSSHQRLLNLNYFEIQQRLIRNKILLTKLETPGAKLQKLIENLKNRVEKDKEVLICVNQIRKSDQIDINEKAAVAKIVMDFKKGCKTVLTIMEEVSVTSVEDSGSDGYHSETDIDHKRLLINDYLGLFKTSRINTLKALDENHQLVIADNLKLKILFSTVVLAFRFCNALKNRKRMEIKKIFATDKCQKNEAIVQLESSIESYFLSTCDSFPLEEVENSVTKQIHSTLQEYACINELLVSLNPFLKSTVRLAWKLCINNMYLDENFTLAAMNQRKHKRSSSSNRKSNIIQAFLWPALLYQNECLSQAIVVT